MSNMMSFGFLLLCFLVCKGVSASDYQTFYFEDFCRSSETAHLHLGSEKANSSGIIEVSKRENFLPNRNCTLWISPPLDHGVVLSVRKLDISPFGQKDCKNYVKITGKQDPIGDEEDGDISMLCVYSDDPTEERSYTTSGAMEIFLHTVMPGKEHSKLTFIVTSFIKGPTECPPNTFQCENNRCIWKGLTCDGHNNCGDRSDERQYSRSQCKYWVVIVIAAGSVLACSFLVSAVTVVWFRRRSRRREEEEEDAEEIGEEERRLLPPRDANNTGRGGSVQYRDVGPSTSHYGTTDREESPPPPYHSL